MPRYFFHVMDSRTFIDKEGTELDSIGDARSEAVRMVGVILAQEETGLLHGHPWRLTVADASGDVVYALSFQADHYGY